MCLFGVQFMSEKCPKQCLINNIIRHWNHNDETTMLPATVQNLTVVPRQADTDEHLIELWLHGFSEHTQHRKPTGKHAAKDEVRSEGSEGLDAHTDQNEENKVWRLKDRPESAGLPLEEHGMPRDDGEKKGMGQMV